MSDAAGMARVLSSIGHAGNYAEGGGGGDSPHVIKVGANENIQSSVDNIVEKSGFFRVMGSLCLGFDTIIGVFKNQGFSLGVVSQAIGSLGTLPSPAPHVAVNPSVLFGKGGGKGA